MKIAPDGGPDPWSGGDLVLLWLTGLLILALRVHPETKLCTY